jgi:hypothetical protein
LKATDDAKTEDRTLARCPQKNAEQLKHCTNDRTPKKNDSQVIFSWPQR